ncbi:hypothetical protein FD755_007862 [Muntiacus reevesi]|uniref:MHC class I-like antigen recognition-like domain-containing protein n=1 Tax=Muntiacus reevesi TaxID=9886 RepID=A0A5J5MMA3_MUNRE|nr:hypothetical protein FD755_007862 [Muntiacus reevesi]
MSLAHTTGQLLLILQLIEPRKTLGSQTFGFVGEEVNDTKAWTELSPTVGEAVREIRIVLPVIKLDKKEMRGPPSLQVRLCCQCEAEQCSGASLLFSINGWTALFLDTMSITWTVIDPGAIGLKEEWENNQEPSDYFRKISVGDCSYWLREFLEHWENMLLPEPTEPLTKAPNNHQPASILLNKCIFPLIFIFIFICLIVIIVKKCMKKSGTTESENQAGLWFLGRFVLVRTSEK